MFFFCFVQLLCCPRCSIHLQIIQFRECILFFSFETKAFRTMNIPSYCSFSYLKDFLVYIIFARILFRWMRKKKIMLPCVLKPKKRHLTVGGALPYTKWLTHLFRRFRPFWFIIVIGFVWRILNIFLCPLLSFDHQAMKHKFQFCFIFLP